MRRRRPRLLLAGAAASLLAAVAIAGALTGVVGGGDGSIDRPRSLMAAKPRPQKAAGTGPAAITAQVLGARRVERSADLTLAAPDDRLEHVGSQIVQVVDRHGGYVLSSSVSSGQGSAHSGSFELRVPTAQLRAAVADLSKLADVRSRTDSGRDVTRSFNSLSDRLTADMVERRGLLRQLAHAPSTGEADRVRSRLDRLSVDIHQLRGQLQGLRQRTDYTRLAVSLVAKPRHSAAAPLGGIDRALRGSLHALLGATAILLRVLAATLPFALLGALGWAAAGALRRRRREAVLS
jgi:hypothetical protein